MNLFNKEEWVWVTIYFLLKYHVYYYKIFESCNLCDKIGNIKRISSNINKYNNLSYIWKLVIVIVVFEVGIQFSFFVCKGHVVERLWLKGKACCPFEEAKGQVYQAPIVASLVVKRRLWWRWRRRFQTLLCLLLMRSLLRKVYLRGGGLDC